MNDPSLINLSILVIGHQIPTKYGGYIDVLGVDVGRPDSHDRAQAGSDAPRGRRPDPRLWLVGSGPESQGGHRALRRAPGWGAGRGIRRDIRKRCTCHLQRRPALNDRHFRIGRSIRSDRHLSCVSVRRANRCGVLPILRRWRVRVPGSDMVRPPEEAEAGRPGKSRKIRSWNGPDYYVVLGRVDRHNRWPLCRKYGFISASGGAPYTKPVRNLTGGGRVFARHASEMR